MLENIARDDSPTFLHIFGFMVRFWELTGYRLALEQCEKCGERKSLHYFSMISAYFYCDNCKPHGNYLRLNEAVRQCLKYWNAESEMVKDPGKNGIDQLNKIFKRHHQVQTGSAKELISLDLLS